MTALTVHGVPVAKRATGQGKSTKPGKSSRRRLKLARRKAVSNGD